MPHGGRAITARAFVFGATQHTWVRATPSPHACGGGRSAGGGRGVCRGVRDARERLCVSVRVCVVAVVVVAAAAVVVCVGGMLLLR